MARDGRDGREERKTACQVRAVSSVVRRRGAFDTRATWHARLRDRLRRTCAVPGHAWLNRHTPCDGRRKGEGVSFEKNASHRSSPTWQPSGACPLARCDARARRTSLLKTRNVYAFIAPLARAGAAASERGAKKKRRCARAGERRLTFRILTLLCVSQISRLDRRGAPASRVSFRVTPRRHPPSLPPWPRLRPALSPPLPPGSLPARSFRIPARASPGS